MKKLLFFTCLLLLAVVTVRAQQPSIERYVIASAGGTYTNGSTLEVDYTIGEIAVLTLNSANNFLTQGFQQPYEAGVFIDELENGMNIFYYPNPVTSNLTLTINNAGSRAFKIEMIDLLGQLITAQSGIANYDGTAGFTFDMQNLATGNYILRISSGGVFIKSIKIIKAGL